MTQYASQEHPHPLRPLAQVVPLRDSSQDKAKPATLGVKGFRALFEQALRSAQSEVEDQ